MFGSIIRSVMAQLSRLVGRRSGATSVASIFHHRQPGATKLIVFVHGVFGSGTSTWGDGTTYWPKMVTGDPRFQDHDVYVFNYPTYRLERSSNVHEIAGQELQRLRDLEVFHTYEHIHFIVHSMGGLVTKSMLTRLAHGRDAQHLRRVRSVTFLSTPAQGAGVAEIGSLISVNPQLANMAPAHDNAFLQSLEDQWTGLLDARDLRRERFPRVHCAYETEPYKTQLLSTILIVPRERAASRSDTELQALPFDHHGIAAPTSVDKDPYAWTMARVAEAGAFDRIVQKIDALLKNVEAMTFSARHDEARRHCEEAERLARETQDPGVHARALAALGDFELVAGRRDQSRARYDEALLLSRIGVSRHNEARALRGLGMLERLTGGADQARTRLLDARPGFQSAGDVRGEADVLRELGELERQLGRKEEATRYFDEAWELYSRAGHPRGHAHVLTGRGYMELHAGRLTEAVTRFTDAQTLYDAAGDLRGRGYLSLGWPAWSRYAAAPTSRALTSKARGMRSSRRRAAAAKRTRSSIWPSSTIG